MVLVPEYLNSKSEVGNLVESVTNSVNLPQPNETTLDSVILTTFNDFSNRARLSSLWPLPYGTSCCFTESASLIGSRFDFDRYGLVPRSSPRQADPIITAGTVTMKMAPCLVRLYEQMPELKYVIAMGACTITGGMPSTDLYSTVRGVDKLIPVDIHLPGCPPKPEAIIDAIIKLRKKVAREVYEHGDKLKQTRRYFILNHQFRIVPIIHTGKHDGQLFSKFTEFSIESNLGTSSKIVEESKSSISSKISSQEIEV